MGKSFVYAWVLSVPSSWWGFFSFLLSSLTLFFFIFRFRSLALTFLDREIGNLEFLFVPFLSLIIPLSFDPLFLFYLDPWIFLLLSFRLYTASFAFRDCPWIFYPYRLKHPPHHRGISLPLYPFISSHAFWFPFSRLSTLFYPGSYVCLDNAIRDVYLVHLLTILLCVCGILLWCDKPSLQ